MRQFATRWLATAAWTLVAAAAGAVDLELRPEDTAISFELDSTLHRVHGAARLEEGSIRFDPAGGPASGSIVVDATSLDTDNGLRDAQMHGKVLESERYPRREFVPERLSVVSREAAQADVVVDGTLRMHGGEWPLAIPARVSAEGGAWRIGGSFVVPYVEWGMRDMSNFLLSVDPEVVVHLDARVPAPAPVDARAVGATGAGQ
ncbi:MAG: YceI family protein [Myxococcota bacterium]